VNFRESNRTRWWICVGLLLAVFAVYWRVGGFEFINFDDPDYVTENNAVKNGLSLGGIFWAFTHFYASNWHPLTWISHMLDCQLFGLQPGGPHIINMLLHAANAVLLFLLLQRLTGAQWRSAIVAALFALHPLHVESVAWISERKDVLSTFFGLLSLLVYAKYVNESKVHPPSPGFGSTRSPKSKVWYAWAIGFFGLSLLSKPMLVTLPFLMLLLDFWPLRRIEQGGLKAFAGPQFARLAREKWPWFALAAASSVITFFAQKTGGAVMGVEHFPLSQRFENAVTSYLNYILKACWPANLTIFYPLPHGPSPEFWVAIIILTIVSVMTVLTIKRWTFLLVGWLWFLGMLVPVIGLVQVGAQAMADRYTYVPLIGLFIAVVWGFAELLSSNRAAKAVGIAATAAVLAAFAAATFSQLQYWKNSVALFTHALAVTRDNAPAHNNLGTALAALGQRPEALAHYAEAVRIQPDNARFHNNLATALLRAGQRDAAVEEYMAAIRADPKFAEAYSNLGTLFLAEHRLAEALTNLNQAVQVDPRNGGLRSNLGNALSIAGHVDEAVAQHLEAVRLDPFDGTVRLNAGLALLKAGRPYEAAVQFAAAVRLAPNSAESRFELGRVMVFDQHFVPAVENLAEAEKLKPNYAAAQFYESIALGELNRYDEATSAAKRAAASAQAIGSTNLLPRIQEALAAYQSRQPYWPK
jgi:tetratricopeptide (TPR) repeat protein